LKYPCGKGIFQVSVNALDPREERMTMRCAAVAQMCSTALLLAAFGQAQQPGGTVEPGYRIVGAGITGAGGAVTVEVPPERRRAN
jgi:hypothetical protein